MGDKPPVKPTFPYLKRSSTNLTTKSNSNDSASNIPNTKIQSNNAPTNSKNISTSISSNTNTISSSLNVDQTQKTFAETTAKFSFPKKDQAIIFNTIDGTPQIEYIKALSSITNPSNIKFASRMSNNRFCVYFVNKNIADDIINSNPSITVNDHIIPIRKLENQSKRIIISNVSPVIPHTYIMKALNNIDINTLTPITFLKAGFTTENLSHIISFRRQTHIPYEDISKLPGSLAISKTLITECFLPMIRLPATFARKQAIPRHIAKICQDQTQIHKKNKIITKLNS